jgi:DnaK suppressor protein
MAKLTKKQLSDAKIELEREYLDLLGVKTSLEAQDETWAKFSTSDQRSRDSNEADPAITERHLLSQVSTANEQAAYLVRRALEKIAEGTYGMCDKCGGSIGKERILARPRSTRCISCA